MISINLNGCPGILHEGGGDIGVVMCSAHGFEELCARKDWRLLAEGLSALGLPVLRFDYHGTGDAPGDDADSGRVAAWLNTLRAAIAYMRESLGVRGVVVCGLRFGAALAATVAQEETFLAFIALNPVVSGRSYARELAMMSKVVAQSPGATPPADGLEVAGFLTSSETLASIKMIDLLKLPKAPAPKVLLLSPGGGGNFLPLIERWRRESTVTIEDFEHFSEWINDPTISRSPVDAFARVLSWVNEELSPQVGPGIVMDRSPRDVSVITAKYIEESVWFGRDRNLRGVLCRPANETFGATTFVLPNAGRNYHIGWARMWVRLARRLAESGHSSLRIDVAGIGDSPDLPGRDPQVMYCDEPVQDLMAAIDALECRGHRNFRVIGLCSGAHLAFHSALRDERINGLVMVNLQRFIWKPEYSLEVAMRDSYRSSGFYKKSAFKFATWARMARGEIRVGAIARELANRSVEKLVAKTVSLISGENEDTAIVRSGFQRLSERGVRTLLVYSDNDAGIDELTRHFGSRAAGLRRFPSASLSYLANADHNLTPLEARDRLNGLIVEFAGGATVSEIKEYQEASSAAA